MKREKFCKGGANMASPCTCGNSDCHYTPFNFQEFAQMAKENAGAIPNVGGFLLRLAFVHVSSQNAVAGCVQAQEDLRDILGLYSVFMEPENLAS